MKDMKDIQTGRVLIIPDVHQNLAFVKNVLEQEDYWDHLVFLGDYVDTHLTVDNITAYNFKATLEFFSELKKTHGDNVTFLVGNHDVSYLSTYKSNDSAERGSPYACSGWTRSKGTQFNRYADPKWINSLELCIRLGDWVCVHAGFMYPHFKPMISEWDNIKALHKEWENDRLLLSSRFATGTHWIGNVSPVRGGRSSHSSPVWVDFMDEFEPVENVRQIVGHTTTPAIPKWKDTHNICVDAMQTCYAVWQHNEVTVKQAYNGQVCRMEDYAFERDERI